MSVRQYVQNVIKYQKTRFGRDELKFGKGQRQTSEKHAKKSKRKYRFGWIALAVFVLGIAIVFGINAYVKISTRDFILTTEHAADFDADCILVLGAGVSGDRPSLLLRDRIDRGIELYNIGASGKIIMSGDHGFVDYDEVNVMKQVAVRSGIASSDIFMDHAGFSTYESLYRAKEIFKANRIIIVTQEYHLYRAIYVARSMGFEVCGVAAAAVQYSGQAYRDAREVLARNKDFLYAIIKPKPTYLGDAIPVWGDGDLTND
jgi:vancomycin permeability regulator SanA